MSKKSLIFLLQLADVNYSLAVLTDGHLPTWREPPVATAIMWSRVDVNPSKMTHFCFASAAFDSHTHAVI